MAQRREGRFPPAASCEDYDSDIGDVLSSTRTIANLSARKLKSPIISKAQRSTESDTGYSSSTAAIKSGSESRKDTKKTRYSPPTRRAPSPVKHKRRPAIHQETTPASRPRSSSQTARVDTRPRPTRRNSKSHICNDPNCRTCSPPKSSPGPGPGAGLPLRPTVSHIPPAPGTPRPLRPHTPPALRIEPARSLPRSSSQSNTRPQISRPLSYYGPTTQPLWTQGAPNPMYSSPRPGLPAYPVSRDPYFHPDHGVNHGYSQFGHPQPNTSYYPMAPFMPDPYPTPSPRYADNMPPPPPGMMPPTWDLHSRPQSFISPGTASRGIGADFRSNIPRPFYDYRSDSSTDSSASDETNFIDRSGKKVKERGMKAKKEMPPTSTVKVGPPGNRSSNTDYFINRPPRKDAGPKQDNNRSLEKSQPQERRKSPPSSSHRSSSISSSSRTKPSSSWSNSSGSAQTGSTSYSGNSQNKPSVIVESKGRRSSYGYHGIQPRFGLETPRPPVVSVQPYSNMRPPHIYPEHSTRSSSISRRNERSPLLTQPDQFFLRESQRDLFREDRERLIARGIDRQNRVSRRRSLTEYYDSHYAKRSPTPSVTGSTKSPSPKEESDSNAFRIKLNSGENLQFDFKGGDKTVEIRQNEDGGQELIILNRRGSPKSDYGSGSDVGTRKALNTPSPKPMERQAIPKKQYMDKKTPPPPTIIRPSPRAVDRETKRKDAKSAEPKKTEPQAKSPIAQSRSPQPSPSAAVTAEFERAMKLATQKRQEIPSQNAQQDSQSRSEYKSAQQQAQPRAAIPLPKKNLRHGSSEENTATVKKQPDVSKSEERKSNEEQKDDR